MFGYKKFQNRDYKQWRIQDLIDGKGCQSLGRGKNLLFAKIFSENCVKMKKKDLLNLTIGAPTPPPKPPVWEILDPPMHVFLPAVFMPESDHVTQLVDNHAEDGAVRTEGDDLAPGTLPPHERTTPTTGGNILFYNRF